MLLVSITLIGHGALRYVANGLWLRAMLEMQKPIFRDSGIAAPEYVWWQNVLGEWYFGAQIVFGALLLGVTWLSRRRKRVCWVRAQAVLLACGLAAILIQSVLELLPHI